MKLSLRILILILVAYVSLPNSVLAHPGRTDSNGGHVCRTNCEKWGEVSGAWHSHGGGEAVPAPKTEETQKVIEIYPTAFLTSVPTRIPTRIPTKQPTLTVTPTLIPTETPTPTIVPTKSQVAKTVKATATTSNGFWSFIMSFFNR